MKDSRSHCLNIIHLHVYGNTIHCVDKFPCADCPDRLDQPQRCPAAMVGKYLFFDKKEYFTQEAWRMRQICRMGPVNPATLPRCGDVPFRELPHFYPVIELDGLSDDDNSIEIEEDWKDQDSRPECLRLWRNLNR